MKSIRERDITFAKKLAKLLQEYNAEITVDGEKGVVVTSNGKEIASNKSSLSFNSFKFNVFEPSHRFGPTKRIALDGKVWWVVYDYEQNNYSSYTCHGKYKTKSDCQWAIDNSLSYFK